MDSSGVFFFALQSGMRWSMTSCRNIPGSTEAKWKREIINCKKEEAEKVPNWPPVIVIIPTEQSVCPMELLFWSLIITVTNTGLPSFSSLSVAWCFLLNLGSFYIGNIDYKNWLLILCFFFFSPLDSLNEIKISVVPLYTHESNKNKMELRKGLERIPYK